MVVIGAVLYFVHHWFMAPFQLPEANNSPPLQSQRQGERDTSRSPGGQVARLLSKYVAGHGNHSHVQWDRDEVCGRKYLVATYACPVQIGNRMHEFLNAFAVAVVSGRTLLWQYCSRPYCRSPEAKCSRALQRKPWMMSYTHQMALMERYGCPVSVASDLPRPTTSAAAAGTTTTATATAAMRITRPGSRQSLEEEYAAMLIHPKNHTSSERVMACCGLHSLVGRVVHLGPLERHEAVVLSLKGAVLDEDSRRRAATLFGAGEYAAYGHLFRRAFEFSDLIKRINLRPNTLAGDEKAALRIFEGRQDQSNRGVWSQLVQAAPAAAPEPMEVRIGLHLRHVSHSDNGDTDHGETRCLRKVVKRLPRGSKCVVLLASDRERTLSRFTRVVHKLGCEVRLAKRPPPDSEPDRTLEHNAFPATANAQMGIWAAGDTVVADVHLLSTAHIFIGSSDTWGLNMLSTYSMLVAALVASRLPQHSIGSIGIDTSGSAAHQDDAFDKWYAKERARKEAWLRKVGEDGPTPELRMRMRRPHPLLNITAPTEQAVGDGVGDGLFPFWLFLDTPNVKAPKKLSVWQSSQRYVDNSADNLLWLPSCGASVGSYLSLLDSPSWKYTNPNFDWECGRDPSLNGANGAQGLFEFDSSALDGNWSPNQCPNKAQPDANDLERARRSYEAQLQAVMDKAEARRNRRNPSYLRDAAANQAANMTALREWHRDQKSTRANTAAKTAMQKRRDVMRARLEAEAAERERTRNPNAITVRPNVGIAHR